MLPTDKAYFLMCKGFAALLFTIIIVRIFKFSAIIGSRERRAIKQSFVTDSFGALGFTSSDCVTSVVSVTLSDLPLH